MSRVKQSVGLCSFCGRQMARGGMSRHLKNCPKRRAAIEAVDADPDGPSWQTLYYLVVQARGSGDYWLHLEMNGTAPLRALDAYLRAIWLECCDHLSAFYGDRWGDEKLPIRSLADQVFRSHAELHYLYDYGSSTELVIRLFDTREGRPLSAHPIMLMARNRMPEEVCIECGKPAAYFSRSSLINYDEWETYCERHGREIEDESYGDPVPLVNSPRVGICGYLGPAEPAY